MVTYTTVYPPTHNDTYVKATTKFGTNYWPYFATDPTKSLTGSWALTSWISVDPIYTNQRFHIDLGSAKIIKRIYYENVHHIGGLTDRGARNYLVQGSNNASAFADLTFANDANWTELQSGLEFDIHVGLDQADPKYQVITNTTAYRYYAIKIADAWGTEEIGLRHIALQIREATPLQINIGDAWKVVDAVQINIGDSWKTVDGMQINIGDTWKTIF